MEGMIEGRRDEEEHLSSYWLTLGKENILELERGSAGWHCTEDSLWKGLRACHKTYCSLMMMTPQRSYTPADVKKNRQASGSYGLGLSIMARPRSIKTKQKLRFLIILGNKLVFEAGTFITIVKL
jgi:hypothetical protein